MSSGKGGSIDKPAASDNTFTSGYQLLVWKPASQHKGHDERQFQNRMDGCDVEPAQGLHENKPRVQALLR
jgi:hypothetical protein